MATLLGELVLKEGKITRSQLNDALYRQRKLAAQGQRQPIGQVLLGLGYLMPEQLEEELAKQRGEFVNIKEWEEYLAELRATHSNHLDEIIAHQIINRSHKTNSKLRLLFQKPN